MKTKTEHEVMTYYLLNVVYGEKAHSMRLLTHAGATAVIEMANFETRGSSAPFFAAESERPFEERLSRAFDIVTWLESQGKISAEDGEEVSREVGAYHTIKKKTEERWKLSVEMEDGECRSYTLFSQLACDLACALIYEVTEHLPEFLPRRDLAPEDWDTGTRVRQAVLMANRLADHRLTVPTAPSAEVDEFYECVGYSEAYHAAKSSWRRLDAIAMELEDSSVEFTDEQVADRIDTLEGIKVYVATLLGFFNSHRGIKE